MALAKKKVRVVIRDFEHQLFRYLYENKVATTQQIHRDIYHNFSLGSVKNRLQKLRHHKLLKGRCHENFDRQLIYSLSDYSFQRFIAPLGIQLRRQLRSDATRHDICLVDIRAILRSFPSIRAYHTENVIAGKDLVEFGDQSFYLGNIHPDAIVEVTIKEKLFFLPLEFESAQKYVDRYKQLFRDYYDNETIAAVLYIVANPALGKTIQGIESKFIGQNSAKFFYSDFSSWDSLASINFTNIRGEKLNIQARKSL